MAKATESYESKQSLKPRWVRVYAMYWPDYMDWETANKEIFTEIDGYDEHTMIKAIKHAANSGNWKRAPIGAQLKIIWYQYKRYQNSKDHFEGTGVEVAQNAIEACYRESMAQIRRIYNSGNGRQAIMDNIWEVICAAEDRFGEEGGVDLADRIENDCGRVYSFDRRNVTCVREFSEAFGALRKKRKISHG